MTPWGHISVALVTPLPFESPTLFNCSTPSEGGYGSRCNGVCSKPAATTLVSGVKVGYVFPRRTWKIDRLPRSVLTEIWTEEGAGSLEDKTA